MCCPLPMINVSYIIISSSNCNCLCFNKHESNFSLTLLMFLKTNIWQRGNIFPCMNKNKYISFFVIEKRRTIVTNCFHKLKSSNNNNYTICKIDPITSSKMKRGSLFKLLPLLSSANRFLCNSNYFRAWQHIYTPTGHTRLLRNILCSFDAIHFRKTLPSLCLCVCMCVFEL